MKKFYLLMMAVVATASLFAQPCSKLFFSEYIEGSSNNKAIEIYNPTASAVNLNGYKICNYTNGAVAPSFTFNLSGVIAAGDVYVIANNLADTVTIRPLADTSTSASAMNFNGNDVLALVNGTDTIDRIGEVGLSSDIQFDTTTGKDHSYVRNANVQQGTLDWNTGKLQWITYAVNTVHLGNHTMTPCGAPTDTSVVFSPTADVVAMTAGTYGININVNNPAHVGSKNVNVVLTGGTGSAADLNNYTTQTVTFPTASVNQTLNLTLTQYGTAQPAKTFIFKLRNTTGGLLVGVDSIFTLTIAAFNPGGTVLPLSNISNFTGLDANYAADSVGVAVRVHGTVYGINYRSAGLQFFIHDATDGIQVFAPTKTFGYTVTEGDSIAVQGTVDFFRGMTQLGNLDTVYKIGTHALVSPTLVPDLDETTESELVRLNNVHLITPSQWDTTAHSSGFSVDVTDGVGNWVVRIDEQTDIFKTNMAKPVANFDVIGLGAQFDTSAPYSSGYQLYPRYHQDIIVHTSINEVNDNIARIYPNPNNGNFIIELKNNTNNAEVKLFDLAGRMVYNTKENSGTIHINLNQMNAGMYVVEVKSGDLVSRNKITVQQ